MTTNSRQTSQNSNETDTQSGPAHWYRSTRQDLGRIREWQLSSIACNIRRLMCMLHIGSFVVINETKTYQSNIIPSGGLIMLNSVQFSSSIWINLIDSWIWPNMIGTSVWLYFRSQFSYLNLLGENRTQVLIQWPFLAQFDWRSLSDPIWPKIWSTDPFCKGTM